MANRRGKVYDYSKFIKKVRSGDFYDYFDDVRRLLREVNLFTEEAEKLSSKVDRLAEKIEKEMAGSVGEHVLVTQLNSLAQELADADEKISRAGNVNIRIR